MLEVSGSALRLVGDVAAHDRVVEGYRRLAIGTTIVAAWALGWALLALLAPEPLVLALVGPDGAVTGLRLLGAVGVGVAIGVAALATWWWRIVARLRALAGGWIVEVSPRGIALPDRGALPWSSIAHVGVAWTPVAMPPPTTLGGTAGAAIGGAVARRHGLGVHRTLWITARGAAPVAVHVAHRADDAAFGRVVAAIEHETTRAGIPMTAVAPTGPAAG